MAPFRPRQTLHSYRCLSLPGSSPNRKTGKMVGLAPAASPPFTPRRRRRSTGLSPSVASEDAPPSLFEPHQILRKKEDLLKGVFLFSADGGTRTHTAHHRQILSLMRLPFRHIRAPGYYISIKCCNQGDLILVFQSVLEFHESVHAFDNLLHGDCI